MTQRIPVVLNPNNKQHIPLADADTIRPSDIPVSPDSGNTVQVRTNGIYVGTEAVSEYAAQYVDAVNGNDATGDGTGTNPYKTIARAVDNMVPGTRGYTVFCHDGQDHVLPSRVVQGISDGEAFVTVDGTDYRQRITTGAVEAARDNTTGVVYHGDIPVTIDAAFLYKNG